MRTAHTARGTSLARRRQNRQRTGATPHPDPARLQAARDKRARRAARRLKEMS